MTNSEAKILVRRTFEKIKKSKSIDDLYQIIKDEVLLSNNQMSAKTYPTLELEITIQDITKLKQNGVISEDNLLSEEISNKELTSLEKLLYSIIWKQGDLTKERHIIEGIEGKKTLSNKKRGLVFFQFGKHLTNRNEPIIDQHVLRAFAIKNNEDDKKIDHYRKLTAIKKADEGLIKHYKEWLTSSALDVDLKKQGNYIFHIDKVLFALGKAIKSSTKKKPQNSQIKEE